MDEIFLICYPTLFQNAFHCLIDLSGRSYGVVLCGDNTIPVTDNAAEMFECINSVVIQRNVASGLVCLGSVLLNYLVFAFCIVLTVFHFHNISVNVNAVFFKINVFPFKIERLTLSHSRIQNEDNEIAVSVNGSAVLVGAFGFFHDSCNFFGSVCGDLLPFLDL